MCPLKLIFKNLPNEIHPGGEGICNSGKVSSVVGMALFIGTF